MDVDNDYIENDFIYCREKGKIGRPDNKIFKMKNKYKYKYPE